MSEQDNEPKTYDNRHLIPYLKAIAECGPDGMLYEESAEKFGNVFQNLPGDEDLQYIGAAKIRQTMYIARLAQKVNGALILTDAGRELIA